MHLIHSGDIPAPYIKNIDSNFPGLKKIPLLRSIDVYESIASHPDIFIFQLYSDTLIVSRSLPGKVVSLVKKTGAHIIKSDSFPQGEYPQTCVLNAAKVGRHIFCNSNYIDKKIKDSARAEGLMLIHVNQGYTRCSIVPVGKEALITSDKGIAKAGGKAGLDVLLVSEGNVLLPKQKHGFLGGATGVMDDRSIVFLGDIEKHPDFFAIKDFLNKHKIEYINIKGLPLFDAGSLIFI